jgi:prepilin-type N-terminal cleavage/methylation domain-containing protein
MNVRKDSMEVNPQPGEAGFSLIEMIGVLAIIAVLAVAIVPKVFSTIATSRITGAVSAVNSIQSATADFTGKYGPMPVTGANSRVDDLLLTAGFLESRFNVKIGTPPSNPAIAGAAWTYANGVWTSAGGASQATQTRILCQASSAAVPSTAAGANFQLDGATNLPTGVTVLSAVIPNVTGTQALALSQAIDGDNLSAASVAVADNAGKVVYAAPSAAGLTTVYIYIAQQ